MAPRGFEQGPRHIVSSPTSSSVPGQDTHCLDPSHAPPARGARPPISLDTKTGGRQGKDTDSGAESPSPGSSAPGLHLSLVRSRGLWGLPSFSPLCPLCPSEVRLLGGPLLVLNTFPQTWWGQHCVLCVPPASPPGSCQWGMGSRQSPHVILALVTSKTGPRSSRPLSQSQPSCTPTIASSSASSHRWRN